MKQWAPDARGDGPLPLLEAAWTEIVGSGIAQNSYPARIAGETLLVVTRSSAWSHQLSFLAQEILRLVAARAPDAGIERLRFRVGPLPTRGRVAPPREAAAALRRAGTASRGVYPGPGAGALPAGRGGARAGQASSRVERVFRLRGAHKPALGPCVRLLSGDAGGRAFGGRGAAGFRGAVARLRWNGGTHRWVKENGVRTRSKPAAYALVGDARASSGCEASLARRPRTLDCELVRRAQERASPKSIMPATVRNVLGDELA